MTIIRRHTGVRDIGLILLTTTTLATIGSWMHPGSGVAPLTALPETTARRPRLPRETSGKDVAALAKSVAAEPGALAHAKSHGLASAATKKLSSCARQERGGLTERVGSYKEPRTSRPRLRDDAPGDVTGVPVETRRPCRAGSSRYRVKIPKTRLTCVSDMARLHMLFAKSYEICQVAGSRTGRGRGACKQ